MTNMSNLVEIASRTIKFLNSIEVQNKQLVFQIVELSTGKKLAEECSERQLELLFSSYVIAKVNEEKRRYSASQLGCNLGLTKNQVEVLLELDGLVVRDDNRNLQLTTKGTEYGKFDDKGRLMWLQCTNRLLRKYTK